ncbi:hypothetical protein BSKO_07754 [Bryopsis sp. KO-2023]|nr:hypothetical protein BSKO_07754 [Bryopsis sp. KO-2023]
MEGANTTNSSSRRGGSSSRAGPSRRQGQGSSSAPNSQAQPQSHSSSRRDSQGSRGGPNRQRNRRKKPRGEDGAGGRGGRGGRGENAQSGGRGRGRGRGSGNRGRASRGGGFALRDENVNQAGKTTNEAEQPSHIVTPPFDPETSACAICCESVEVVAIGQCNHALMCGPCCLRMRMCYDDKSCPFCKANLTKVVILKQSPNDQPAFDSFISQTKHLWNKESWAKGVYVDKRRKHNGFSLFDFLQRMSAWSCSVCDKQGDNQFPSHRQLRHHLKTIHGRDLCSICTKAGRTFPLDMETYPVCDAQPGETTMQEHAETHPRCDFCDIKFFDKDELFNHMRREHCTCHVCERGGIHFQYFKHGQELLTHMRTCHYVCTEPNCVDSFVAFASEEELAGHHRDAHTGHMPRWNSQRARPLALDYMHRSLGVVLGEDPEPPPPPNGGGRRRNRNRRRNQNDGQGSAPQIEQRWDDAVHDADVVDTSGFLQVIDDNEIPADRARSQSTAQRGWGPVSRGLNDAVEEFPSLSASIAERGEAHQPGVPKLVTVQVRCPCGRRIQHPVVEEGKPEPRLDCNGECAKRNRRSQLADAFGVGNPDSYVPVADRPSSKIVKYPIELITWAREDPDGVSEVERHLQEFLLDSKEQRTRITLSPKIHKTLVQKLAELYGVIPRRSGDRVELFRTPSAAPPHQSLTRFSAMMSEEEYWELVNGAESLTLTLVDVDPRADIHGFLSHWAGEYILKRSGTTATVAFTTKANYDSASSHLAGGRRGQFRIQKAPSKQQKSSHQSHDGAGSSNWPGWIPESVWISVPGQVRSWGARGQGEEEESSTESAWDDPVSEWNKPGHLVLTRNKKKPTDAKKEKEAKEREPPISTSNRWEPLMGVRIKPKQTPAPRVTGWHGY